jgi:hypothetical protein
MKKYFILTFWVLIAVVSRTSGQSETFDIVSFTPPAGWERKQQTSVLLFTKNTENPKAFCEIAIYKSRTGTNDLQIEFVNEWSDLIKKSKSIDVPVQRTVENGTNGWSLISAKALSQTTPPYESILVTIVGFGRVTSILFFVSDDKFMPEISAFLGSMKMVAPETPSVSSTIQQPQRGTNTITGIWRSACDDKSSSMGVTNASGTGYALLSTSTGGLRTRHIVCFSDGTFCQYVTPSGFFNYPDQRAKNPDTWGVYHYDNGAGSVKLDGLASSFPFTVADGQMKYDGCLWKLLPSVEELQLNGTYSWESNPAIYKSHGMNSEPIIRFTPDGRFADTGAVYYLNHVKHESPDMSDNKYGDGRYEVKNYTLSLYFDDSRIYHYTFLNFDGNVSNPEQLSVGLAFLTRK